MKRRSLYPETRQSWEGPLCQAGLGHHHVSRRQFMKGAAGMAGLVLPLSLKLPRLVRTSSAQTLSSSIIRAATRKVDITPLNKGFPIMWLGGFANRGGVPAQGVSKPVFARVLAIQDETSMKVIVTADILGFPSTLHQQIVGAVHKYGLSERNVLLAASHNHSGPVLTGNLDPAVSYFSHLTPQQTANNLNIVSAYTQWLRRGIVDLIGAAVKDLQTASEVTLSYGVGSADLANNRDDIFENEDQDVPVLAVRRPDSSLLAVVFGYACHPIRAGEDGNTHFLYHSDFPGVACEQLESTTGATAFFIQGAAGDLNPSGMLPEITAQSIGTELADEVQRVLVGSLDPVNGPILTQYREVRLPLNFDPNDPNQTQLQAAYSGIASTDPGIGQGDFTAKWWTRHAEQIVEQINQGVLPEVEQLPVQVWHFGSTTSPSLVLAALGGEVVSGYSLFLKDQFASTLGDTLWVAAYGNEVPGYIPSNQIWDKGNTTACGTGFGNYEAGWNWGRCRGPFIASGSQMFYGWPAPLKRGSNGEKGMEELVIENTVSMIQSQ